jgi:hypothetical protein
MAELGGCQQPNDSGFAIDFLREDPASKKNNGLVGGYDESRSIYRFQGQGFERAGAHVKSYAANHFCKRNPWHFPLPGVVHE